MVWYYKKVKGSNYTITKYMLLPFVCIINVYTCLKLFSIVFVESNNSFYTFVEMVYTIVFVWRVNSIAS